MKRLFTVVALVILVLLAVQTAWAIGPMPQQPWDPRMGQTPGQEQWGWLLWGEQHWALVAATKCDENEVFIADGTGWVIAGLVGNLDISSLKHPDNCPVQPLPALAEPQAQVVLPSEPANPSMEMGCWTTMGQFYPSRSRTPMGYVCWKGTWVAPKAEMPKESSTQVTVGETQRQVAEAKAVVVSQNTPTAVPTAAAQTKKSLLAEFLAPKPKVVVATSESESSKLTGNEQLKADLRVQIQKFRPTSTLWYVLGGIGILLGCTFSLRKIGNWLGAYQDSVIEEWFVKPLKGIQATTPEINCWGRSIKVQDVIADLEKKGELRHGT